MKKRLVLLPLLVGVMAVLLPIPRAFACSCVPSPEEDRAVKLAIQRADGAVLGTVIKVDDASDGAKAITLQVEAASGSVSGATLAVQSPADTCGLFVQPGQRVGFLLRSELGAWNSDLCSTVAPALLTNALVRMGQAERPPPQRIDIVHQEWIPLWAWIAGAAVLALGGITWGLVRRRKYSEAHD